MQIKSSLFIIRYLFDFKQQVHTHMYTPFYTYEVCVYLTLICNYDTNTYIHISTSPTKLYKFNCLTFSMHKVEGRENVDNA